jgi:hypothetical protein
LSESTQSIRNQRRPRGYVSSISTNFVHLRNPWVTACWAAAFPGFGHIILGSYVKGFLLIIWEIIINLASHANLAILYSFIGKFDQAKQTFDRRWGILYVAVFVYSIWDSYRTTVDLNKLYKLAKFENSPIVPGKIGTLEINYFDKRVPWLAAAWSFTMPGLGHLYSHRLPTGFFVLTWWIVITYFSHILEAMYFTAIGEFSQAIIIADPQWLLFMPSLFGVTIYDSYTNTVEYNKLFEIEQEQFLKDNYQDASFRMPL